MATFDRELTGFRIVETIRGDSLKRLSLRELGDASLWVEIALFNDLRSPYLVDSEADRAAGVAVAGDSLRVPAPVSMATTSANPELVFGRDLAAINGFLEVIDGDMALVSGGDNFLQALRHRLKVVKRELCFHPEYGCWVARLIGRVTGPTAGNLAAFYVRSAILEDDRVQSVPRCTSRIDGDVIYVDADVVPIFGRQINISMVI